MSSSLGVTSPWPFGAGGHRGRSHGRDDGRRMALRGSLDAQPAILDNARVWVARKDKVAVLFLGPRRHPSRNNDGRTDENA